jgi:hypothetical protein
MGHHKRRRPKSTRAGCLLCKYWKHQASKKTYNNQTRQEKKALLSETEQKKEVFEDVWKAEGC